MELWRKWISGLACAATALLLAGRISGIILPKLEVDWVSIVSCLVLVLVLLTVAAFFYTRDEEVTEEKAQDDDDKPEAAGVAGAVTKSPLYETPVYDYPSIVNGRQGICPAAPLRVLPPPVPPIDKIPGRVVPIHQRVAAIAHDSLIPPSDRYLLDIDSDGYEIYDQ